MIYDMVNNALASLTNQWDSLGESLRDLAIALGTQLTAAGRQLNDAQTLGNPDSLGQPMGLQSNCDNPVTGLGESQRIETARLALNRMVGPRRLINETLDVFRQSAGIQVGGIVGRGGGQSAIRIAFDAVFIIAANAQYKNLPEYLICDQQIDQLKDFIERAILDFREVTTEDGQRANIAGIRGSVEDISSYPILTTDLGMPPRSTVPSAGGGGTGASGGTNTLARTVDGAFRDVLGRLPRTSDTRSFMVALNTSFDIFQVEGHTDFSWTPRAYSGQTDLGGGVTGGQASLVTRSQVAVDNSMPILDRLYPLRVDFDQQLVDAARSIVRSTMQTLIQELALEGGPRVARVEQLFDQLLGVKDSNNSTTVSTLSYLGSNFGYMETQFGLVATQVNTIEEESDYTDFLSLKDYAGSIRTSWDLFRANLLGKDLGTRLVLLSRALSVAAETVEEIYAAMDSVYVGEAEREVTAFRDEQGEEILIGDLLSWVVDFTTNEAPTLVSEGGRQGIGQLVPTSFLLVKQIGSLIRAIPNDPLLPNGLRHPRVRHPLQELQGYLKRVVRLAEQARTP